MREENFHQSLEGICVGCRTQQEIPFQEELHVKTLYLTGDCPGCGYEHWIFKRKI